LDFVHARFTTSVWLQAGQHLALAAQIPAKQKSGCRPLAQAQAQGQGQGQGQGTRKEGQQVFSVYRGSY
jgi:hypothetical protein